MSGNAVTKILPASDPAVIPSIESMRLGSIGPTEVTASMK